jgi:hypothetical protein
MPKPWMAYNPSTPIFPRIMGLDDATRLPFMAMLNLPDLSKLLNDSVCHDLSCPPVPTKIPYDIPKFKGNIGKDSGDHVTTFHLWFSSNSLNVYSILLRLFQCTIMGGHHELVH